MTRIINHGPIPMTYIDNHRHRPKLYSFLVPCSPGERCTWNLRIPSGEERREKGKGMCALLQVFGFCFGKNQNFKTCYSLVYLVSEPFPKSNWPFGSSKIYIPFNVLLPRWRRVQEPKHSAEASASASSSRARGCAGHAGLSGRAWPIWQWIVWRS